MSHLNYPEFLDEVICTAAFSMWDIGGWVIKSTFCIVYAYCFHFTKIPCNVTALFGFFLDKTWKSCMTWAPFYHTKVTGDWLVCNTDTNIRSPQWNCVMHMYFLNYSLCNCLWQYSDNTCYLFAKWLRKCLVSLLGTPNTPILLIQGKSYTSCTANFAVIFTLAY